MVKQISLMVAIWMQLTASFMLEIQRSVITFAKIISILLTRNRLITIIKTIGLPLKWTIALMDVSWVTVNYSSFKTDERNKHLY